MVAAAQVPFLRGGAEWHARALVEELRARGFLADLVQLPFQWDPRRDALRSALAWRLLDFSQSNGRPIDLLSATRFPSSEAPPCSAEARGGALSRFGRRMSFVFFLKLGSARRR